MIQGELDSFAEFLTQGDEGRQFSVGQIGSVLVVHLAGERKHGWVIRAEGGEVILEEVDDR